MSANQPLLQEIYRVAEEIEHVQNKIKQEREEVKEAIITTVAQTRIDDLKAQLGVAQEQLKSELMGDSGFLKVTEELAEHRAQLHDLQEILSFHLMQYRDETKETQVPLPGASNKAKPMLISARLGKEQYYQEAMKFAEAADAVQN